MAKVIDGAGGLDAGGGKLERTRELERGVEEEGAEWWVGRLPAGLGVSEGADAGCGGEVERQEEDIALGDGRVNGLGGECVVDAGGDDD